MSLSTSVTPTVLTQIHPPSLVRFDVRSTKNPSEIVPAISKKQLLDSHRVASEWTLALPHAQERELLIRCCIVSVFLFLLFRLYPRQTLDAIPSNRFASVWADSFVRLHNCRPEHRLKTRRSPVRLKRASYSGQVTGTGRYHRARVRLTPLADERPNEGSRIRTDFNTLLSVLYEARCCRNTITNVAHAHGMHLNAPTATVIYFRGGFWLALPPLCCRTHPTRLA
jgi:hypothetical protein